MVYGVSSYNQQMWEEVSPTLKTPEGGDNIHKVLVIEDENNSDGEEVFQWYVDDIAVTLRSRSGSYGGGSEVLVISCTPTQSEHCAMTIIKGQEVNMLGKEN